MTAPRFKLRNPIVVVVAIAAAIEMTAHICVDENTLAQKGMSAQSGASLCADFLRLPAGAIIVAATVAAEADSGRHKLN